MAVWTDLAAAWGYKSQITSTKLAQMVANTIAHDHRSDGSQGDPIGQIVAPQFLSAAVALTTVAASVGQIVIPKLNRPAVLYLMLSFTPGSATAGQVGLIPDYSQDGRLANANLGALRGAFAAAAVGHFLSWQLPIAAGAAGNPLPFTAASSVNGTGRLYSWVQG